MKKRVPLLSIAVAAALAGTAWAAGPIGINYVDGARTEGGDDSGVNVWRTDDWSHSLISDPGGNYSAQAGGVGFLAAGKRDADVLCGRGR